MYLTRVVYSSSSSSSSSFPYSTLRGYVGLSACRLQGTCTHPVTRTTASRRPALQVVGKKEQAAKSKQTTYIRQEAEGRKEGRGRERKKKKRKEHPHLPEVPSSKRGAITALKKPLYEKALKYMYPRVTFSWLQSLHAIGDIIGITDR